VLKSLGQLAAEGESTSRQILRNNTPIAAIVSLALAIALVCSFESKMVR
jgi:hypothetical protein